MLTRLEILADRSAAYDGGPLVSRIRRPVDDCNSPSITFPARVLTHAPRRRRPNRCPPLNVPIRRPAATTTNCLAASDGGGAISRPVVRVRSAIALPRSRSPRTLLPDFLQCFGHATAGCVIVCRRQWGPASPTPLRPADDPTPFTPEVLTQAKSRVSIENRELRLSTRECDFLGINNPTLK